MRALSERAASRCETAKHSVCRCRCRGVFHGARRHAIGYQNAADHEALFDASFFWGLPEDDPHHVRSAEEKRARRRKPDPPAPPPPPSPKPAPRQISIWEYLNQLADEEDK